MNRFNLGFCAMAAIFILGCDDDEKPSTGIDGGVSVDGAVIGGPANCEKSELTLPEGFCATVVADNIKRARHLVVAPSGVVYVAVAPSMDGDPGEVVAILDANQDGVADRTERFGDEGGNGIGWYDNYLFVATNHSIVRYEIPAGGMVPERAPDTVVSGLINIGDHRAKSITFDSAGQMYVNIGSASNSCQEENRKLESPGINPCPEMTVRAGIWRFDGTKLNQEFSAGERYASGVRNANALTYDTASESLIAVVNGRDQLFENWPDLYTAEDDRRLPSEEFIKIKQGADYGWPYCYHDADKDQMILAPEYGGNGETVGLCEDVAGPDLAFPAHWAPLAVVVYHGEMFPEKYRSGAFVSFHGSRFEPDAQGDLPGYSVEFVGLDDEALPLEGYETFADGFAGDGRPLPEKAMHRPIGLAEATDGSLYISDDQGGRIWRVYYMGEE